MPMFSNLREDWQTYDGSLLRQGLWVMLVYRFGKWSEGLGSRVLRAPFSLAYRLLRTLCQVLTGVDLPCEAKVGRRLLIEHCGSIVISAETRIGDDCVIRQGVACGPRQRGLRGAPRIGNGVEIGAGAKLLGSERRCPLGRAARSARRRRPGHDEVAPTSRRTRRRARPGGVGDREGARVACRDRGGRGRSHRLTMGAGRGRLPGAGRPDTRPGSRVHSRAIRASATMVPISRGSRRGALRPSPCCPQESAR